jgi:hypothetical protein
MEKVFAEGSAKGLVELVALAQTTDWILATVWYPKYESEEVQGWGQNMKLAIRQPLPRGRSSCAGVVARIRMVAKFSSIPEDGIRGEDQTVGRVLTHSDARDAVHELPRCCNKAGTEPGSAVVCLGRSRRRSMTNDPVSDAKAAATRGDFESAVSLLRPLAEAGNREALYELGSLALTECELISGREAFSLFMKAAQGGHVEAMYHLATFPDFISEPFRSPLSEEEAWQWLLRAAEGGCVQAQRDAGASLATGEWREGKIPQDLAAAVGWYRRAAGAGHADAQYNLASMLAEGEGCDQDLPAAREWLKRAVAGGYDHAEGLLAHLDSLQAESRSTEF